MKKLFFLLALAIAVKVSYASPREIKFDNPSKIQTTESLSMDSPAISFIAYWSLGDSYLYKVTKSEKLWKEGVLSTDNTTSSFMRFTIIDSTATGYKIRWTFDTDFSQFSMDKRYYDMLSKYQTTEVIYTTTELGEIIEIENWQEISAKMNEMMTLFLDVIATEDPAMAVRLESAMKPLMEIYSSQEAIENFLWDDLGLFHFPFGYEFDVNETLEYVDYLPNVMGGDPIRGDVQLYFEEVDYANSYCKMIREMQINSEDAKKLLVSLLQSMGASGDDLEQAMRKAQYDVKDYNVFEFVYNPGFPIRIETQRELLMNFANEEGRSVETTIMEYYDESPVLTEDKIFDAPEIRACLMNTEKDCDKLSGASRDDCCLSSILGYLAQIEYPKEAKDLGVEGKVLVRFVVEKDGKLTQIEKIRGDDMFAASAIKHIQNSSGRWIPATNNGEPVRSIFVAPFTFKLNNNNDKEK